LSDASFSTRYLIGLIKEGISGWTAGGNKEMAC
jgi:hypothetical protein